MCHRSVLCPLRCALFCYYVPPTRPFHHAGSVLVVLLLQPDFSEALIGAAYIVLLFSYNSFYQCFVFYRSLSCHKPRKVNNGERYTWNLLNGKLQESMVLKNQHGRHFLPTMPKQWQDTGHARYLGCRCDGCGKIIVECSEK